MADTFVHSRFNIPIMEKQKIMQTRKKIRMIPKLPNTELSDDPVVCWLPHCGWEYYMTGICGVLVHFIQTTLH